MKYGDLDALITLWFAEDIGEGDHTTLSSIPADAVGTQQLLVKEEGIIAGIEVAKRIIAHFDAGLKVEQLLEDGAYVRKGDVAFRVTGSVRSLLQVERTMLNIMQRMSGIATTTHRYVEALKGTNTRVLDTRKTTPGLRYLEKEAVRIGGGTNHRIGLFDMILLKDNHVDFAGGITAALTQARDYCQRNGKDLKIEIETRSEEEIREALATGIMDRIMLDNFTPERTAAAVRLIRQWSAAGNKYVEIESSGGITIDTIRAYAECGVDFVSVGALTHSVKSLDMSFKAVK